MRTTFTWMTTALGVFLLAVMLIPACSQGDEDALPTSSSALSSDRSLESTGPVTQKDDDSEDGDSSDEDSSDEVSSDEDSSDEVSSDEDSSDDSNGDVGSGDLDDNGSRVRDLVLAPDACPSPLTIGTTVVNTTAETRFDCEPGCGVLFEHLTSEQFCPFLVAGLPMRARGTNDGGVLNASRVRIDDEIKVTGMITFTDPLTPGTLFTLNVDGLTLDFVVGAGAVVDPVGSGETVRVEGIVPGPLTAGVLPRFVATEIQN